jgi:hypothetical protein
MRINPLYLSKHSASSSTRGHPPAPPHHKCASGRRPKTEQRTPEICRASVDVFFLHYDWPLNPNRRDKAQLSPHEQHSGGESHFQATARALVRRLTLSKPKQALSLYTEHSDLQDQTRLKCPGLVGSGSSPGFVF